MPPVNMVDGMEEVTIGGEKTPEGNGTFAVLYCTIFRMPSFHKSLKFFGTSSTPLDPERIQLLACLSHVYGYRSMWPAREAISLALVPRLYVLRMTETRLFVVTAGRHILTSNRLGMPSAAFIGSMLLFSL